jgi:hypothetical protein
MKFIPTTNSVSQLTSTSMASHHTVDETSKHISKQYVSDYILSQPFDANDEQQLTSNGMTHPSHVTSSTNIGGQFKRMLPTAHIRHKQQQQEKFEHEHDATSSPDSASAIDEHIPIVHGKNKRLP